MASTTKNHLTIMQFNIQSLKPKKALLINFLQEHDVDICLLNETFCKDKYFNSYNIPSYNFIHKDAKNEHGGVGMFIKNNFKYNFINTKFYEKIQTIGISLHTEAGIINLLCVYCPPRNGRFNTNQLKHIIENFPRPALVCGDFNAHHVAFGCHKTDSRGTNIFNLFDDSDFCLLNTGSPTTNPPPNKRESAIDISFASPQITPLCEWQVIDDPMGSYHMPILIKIQISPYTYSNNNYNSRHFLYNKGKWDDYRSFSETLTKNFCIDKNNPLKSYDEYCKNLSLLKEKFIPKSKVPSNNSLATNRQPVPWWTDECLDMVKQSKSALNEYRKNPTMANFIEYKKKDAIKKKFLSEQKTNSWRNLCKTFNRTTPISRIWNFIRIFKKLGNRNKTKSDEWIPSFLDRLAPDSAPGKSVDFDLVNSYFQQQSNNNNDFLSRPFSWDEFNFSLSSRRDTTPGLDDLPYILIKKLHLTSQKVLLNIFNELWRNQEIPLSWKTQCVIPVLKPNKPHDSAESYRPISLSSCIGKIFENMIKTRLDHFVEMNSILPPCQFGFRKGRSPADSFSSLIYDLKNSLLSHSNTICVFLDVQGAFDNVDPATLAKILYDIGVPGNVNKWIFNFLYERRIYVKYNNIIHGPKLAFKGIMQGATISPLLYNIYVSQICKYVNENDVTVLQFADDLVLYCKNQNINIAANKINNTLLNLHNYYYNILKLNISAEKSAAMIFNNFNIGEIKDTLIQYGNNSIPIVKSKKFLGVILDTSLSFRKHIDYIISNANKGLNILKSLAGLSWGADPKILGMLYKSIVRSHFDYSTLGYMIASNADLKKIGIIQNKALRIITGAMKTTPINAMEVETGIPPLSIRRLEFALRFCIKNLSINNGIVLEKIKPITCDIPEAGYFSAHEMVFNNPFPMLKFMNFCFNKYKNIYKGPNYSCYNYSIQDNLYKTTAQVSRMQNKFDFLKIIGKKHGYYRVYTDGSKHDEIVRSAFYDPQCNISKSFKLDKFFSIFSAEAYAILKALEYITNITNDKFIIICDSLSVLTSLNNNNVKNCNYLILEVKKNIVNLLGKKTVEFLWVPSHKGISGNEIVDKVAYLGLNEEDAYDVLVPHQDYHADVKVISKRLWRQIRNITLEKAGAWYGSIQKTIPTKPWYHNLTQADRRFVTTICRLRFGHCRTPAHLNRFKIVADAKCEHCGDDNADITHLIKNCPHFGIQRLLLLSRIKDILLNEEVPRQVNELLSNEELFPAIYDFIVSTVNEI